VLYLMSDLSSDSAVYYSKLCRVMDLFEVGAKDILELLTVVRFF
jgi:hypothetical protein